ncbi:MAG: hypothetical protein ACLS6W_07015 [Ruminococcus sp.]
MKLRNKLHGTALALSLFLLMGTATACGSDNNSDSSEKIPLQLLRNLPMKQLQMMHLQTAKQPAVMA